MQQVNWREVAMKLQFIVVSVALIGCSPKPEVEKPKPHPVTVTKAVTRDVPLYYETIGHTRAYQTAQIKPQVTGLIVKVPVHNGAQVAEGQLLAVIDPSMYQATLDEAQAQLAENQASLQINAERVERYKTLLAKEYVSALDYSTYTSQLAQSRAAVQVSEAKVKQAQIDLDWTQIHAPFAGKVGSVLLDVGNLAVANTSDLIVLNQISPIYVDFSVPEVQFPRIMEQQKKQPLMVQLWVPGISSAPRLAPLYSIDNKIQQNSGTLALEALDPNADTALWPGQYVKVRLIFDSLSHAVLIPEAAVSRDADGSYCYVITGDSAQKRPVQLISQPAFTPEGLEGDWCALFNGVQEGEAVVTSGQQRLKPNAEVTVK